MSSALGISIDVKQSHALNMHTKGTGHQGTGLCLHLCWLVILAEQMFPTQILLTLGFLHKPVTLQLVIATCYP